MRRPSESKFGHALAMSVTILVGSTQGVNAAPASVVPDESVVRGEQMVNSLNLKQVDVFLKLYVQYDRSAVDLWTRTCELESRVRAAERKQALTNELAASYLKESSGLERQRFELRNTFIDELQGKLPSDRVAAIALAIRLAQQTAVCPERDRR